MEKFYNTKSCTQSASAKNVVISSPFFYDNVGMGGLKVDTVAPQDDAFHTANSMGGERTETIKMRYEVDQKTRFRGSSKRDQVYCFPSATGRSWLVQKFTDSAVPILAIDEKTAALSVKLVAAAAINSGRAGKVHIALKNRCRHRPGHDPATIRPKGKPAVDDIATMMRKETAHAGCRQ